MTPKVAIQPEAATAIGSASSTAAVLRAADGPALAWQVTFSLMLGRQLIVPAVPARPSMPGRWKTSIHAPHHGRNFALTNYPE
jgi:hypothetical protein